MKITKPRKSQIVVDIIEPPKNSYKQRPKDKKENVKPKEPVKIAAKAVLSSDLAFSTTLTPRSIVTLNNEMKYLKPPQPAPRKKTEHKRRAEIQQYIDELVKELPDSFLDCNKRHTRYDILHQALKYIKYLEQDIERISFSHM